MKQRRYSATAIAHLIGRLILISGFIGSSFSLYALMPVLAQSAAQTVAQTADESEDSSSEDPAADTEDSESEDSETTTDSTESPDSAPSADQRSPLSTARPNLRLGSQGQAVGELQALLKLLGYYTGAVDGRYSEETADAVSEFQTAAGLTADGVVGPATWGRLLPAAPVASPTATAEQTTDLSTVTVTDFPTPILTPGDLASGTAPAETETDRATAPSTTNSAATPAPTPNPADAADTTTDAPAGTPAADAAADAESTTESTTESTGTASLPADESNPAAFPTLRIGASGPAVERLQERLQSLGHYQGAVDGIFGERTQEAVRAAQRSNQLGVDGVVGPATWEILLDR